jgi:hypothetical protein
VKLFKAVSVWHHAYYTGIKHVRIVKYTVSLITAALSQRQPASAGHSVMGAVFSLYL